MEQFNSIPLTKYAATFARAIGIEPPHDAEEPIDWVLSVLKDLNGNGYDRLLIHNPDGVGLWHYRKHPDAFLPVLKHTQLTIPFESVMPAITPVNFATMYTGAAPEAHGVTKYETPKPVVKIDTLFDSLIRAGKKVAILGENNCSMCALYAGKGADIFKFETEGDTVEKALEMIVADEYDVICVYTYLQDTLNHIYGPETPQTLNALYHQGEIFDELVSTAKRSWTGHNTIFSFSPDHGVHGVKNSTDLYHGVPKKGSHGLDAPIDRNILHYVGVSLKQEEIDLMLE